MLVTPTSMGVVVILLAIIATCMFVLGFIVAKGGGYEPEGGMLLITIIFVCGAVLISSVHNFNLSVKTAMHALCELNIAKPEFSDVGDFLGYKINIAEKE